MSIRRALLFAFLDRYSGVVITLATNMAIARLLTPKEVGIFSIVMVLVGFVAVFRDMGAGQYLIRHPDLTDDILRRTLAMQFTMGTLLAALMMLAAWPIAAFYREPQMLTICWLMAASFLLMPLMSYPVSWLTREMRFGQLAMIRVVGSLCSAGTTVSLALCGAGPIGLALGNLATTLAAISLIHLWIRPHLPWRPLWRGIGSVLRFGGMLTAVSILNSLRAGLPELVVGRGMGLAHAAMLSRGQGLSNLFDTLVASAVNQVMTPYFAQQMREGRPVAVPALRAMALLTAIGWPFFAVLGALAEPVILVLFGSQWGEAVAPARWLMLAGAGLVPLYVLTAAQLALGRVRELLGLTLLMLVGHAVAAPVAFVGGLESFAAALGAASVASGLLGVALFAPRIGMSLSALFTILTPGLILAAATSVGPLILAAVAPPSHGTLAALPLLIGGGALAVIGWVSAAWCLKHPAWVELSGRVTAFRVARRAPPEPVR